MKRIFMLPVMASVLIMGSCKKNSGSQSEIRNDCKIVKYTSSYDDTSPKKEYELTYNADGRVATISNSGKIRRFSYEPNRMLVSVGSLLLTYNYNALKQISEITTNEGYQEKVSVKYEGNKVSKILTSIDNISSTFTYSGNDVVKVVEKWGDVESREYLLSYKDEKYSDPLIFELTFPGMIDGEIRHFIGYSLANSFGGENKRLIDKIKYIPKGSFGSGEAIINFSYLKDGNGKIVQIIGWQSSNLEYNCK